VPADVKQATLKGRQWRYGITVWAFMVAGLVARRSEFSTEPCDPQPRKRKRDEAAAAATAASLEGSDDVTPAATLASTTAVDGTSDAGSDAGSVASGCTMSGGEEEGEQEAVPEPDATTTEWVDTFGDKEMQEAVLDVVCRGAHIMARLCLDNEFEKTHWTEEEIRSLAVEAREFVTKYVRVLFGAIHTSKMHRLAYHLADELLLRGNLTEADTSVNEMLMKLCKAMYSRTNKQVTTFKVQLLRAQQTLERIIAEDAEEADLEEASKGEENELHGVVEDEDAVRRHDKPTGEEHANGALVLEGVAQELILDTEWPEGDHGSACDRNDNGSSVGGGDNGSGGGGGDGDRGPVGGDGDGDCDGCPTATSNAVPSRHKRIRVRGQCALVGDVAKLHYGRLQALPELLGLDQSAVITVRNSADICASFEWKASPTKKERMQQVRAADQLWGGAWYDHVRWLDADDVPCYGLVRLVLCAKAGIAYHAVVVQRLVASETRKNCVLSSWGCERLKWQMDEGTGFPALEVLKLTDVQRLEHIVPDFEDLCERHGLLATPGSVADTPGERTLQRFFTNVWCPWTGGLSYERSR